MPNIKEKLVELYNKLEQEGLAVIAGKSDMADLMIANGVTFATDNNVGDKQNQADRIRAMSDEELAKWLADIWDCYDCSEHERLGDSPLLREEPCDQKCEEHCLNWLRQPADET